MLIIGIIAVPVLPRAHAATGTYFDNIVVIAMENRAYTEVIGNSNAPFINSLIALSATLQHYNSYGAAGRSVGGCSAGCYTALVSGSDQGISDGYGCCITSTTLMDRMGTAGLTWQAYCESGCPRGNDHFPFTGFASTSSSPNVFTGSNVSPSDLITAASSPSPPNLLWYTPTDNNNMHDGSVSTGDAYIQNFLTGSGSLTSPSPGSLLATSIFQPGHRTLLLLWWDECAKGSFGCDSNNSTPNVWFGPTAGISAGHSSTSTVYDEYSILHLIENNWALPTLASNDAAAAPMTEIFGSSTPPAPTTSFTTYTLSFQGFDFDGANEETITMNGALVASVPSVLTAANGATWVSFSFDITSFVVTGTNTLSFTHASADCPTLDQVRNLVIADQTITVYNNATAENINIASSCTNTLTYHFVNQAAPGGNTSSGGSSNGSCPICGIIPTGSPTILLLAAGGLLGLASSFAILTLRARASLQHTKRRLRN